MRIPVPDARALQKEIESDMEAIVLDLVAEGVSVAEARVTAGASFSFDPQETLAMEGLKNTGLFRWLTQANLSIQQMECLASLLPLAGLTYYMHMEVPMFDIMYQGGVFTWILFALGLVGVFLQGRMLFSWFVLKNHHDGSLNKSLKLPLNLGIVSFLFGILGTAIGLFIVFTHMPEVGVERFSSVLMMGIKESLVNLVFGTSVLAVIASLHIFLSELVRRAQLPVV